MLNKYTKKQKGFTLVEMLVSIAVFMVVVTSAVGALYSIIDANRKAQAIKNVINNVDFALESISREMRMGESYKCNSQIAPFGQVDCDVSIGNSVVSFISYKDLDLDGEINDRVLYRFVRDNPEGNIQRKLYDSVGSDWESLTAPESTVKIKNMVFYIIAPGNKVFITVEGESGTKASLKTDFSLQTTITQRSQE